MDSAAHVLLCNRYLLDMVPPGPSFFNRLVERKFNLTFELNFHPRDEIAHVLFYCFREARTAVCKQTFPNIDCADHSLLCDHCLLDMFPRGMCREISCCGANIFGSPNRCLQRDLPEHRLCWSQPFLWSLSVRHVPPWLILCYLVSEHCSDPREDSWFRSCRII